MEMKNMAKPRTVLALISLILVSISVSVRLYNRFILGADMNFEYFLLAVSMGALALSYQRTLKEKRLIKG